MLDKLTHDDFEAHLNTTFTVQTENVEGLDDPHEVELVEVEAKDGIDEGMRAPNATRTPFNLVFKGSGEILLNQGTFTLTHDSMDDLTIFLVPIGKEAGNYMYEVVFT